MIEALLNTENVPSELHRLIQEKVEGNPFYLEEVTNSLIESKAIVCAGGRWRITRQITEQGISSTIHGVIGARLDRLEKETKRILQEASVIGRSFFYEILKRVTDLKKNIDDRLSSLERLDFIKARSLDPDLEYVFKHALTQEVVYDGLLIKERQTIHERVANVIEEIFQDRLPEFYETMAFHFKQGKSIKKAVKYLMKSGEKSIKRYAVKESHKYYEEGFTILKEKLDKNNVDNELLIDLLIKWAYVFYYNGDFNGLIDLLNSHKNLAASLDDKGKNGMFNGWLGFAYWMSGECDTAYSFLCKALDLGEETGNQEVIGYACCWLVYNAAELGMLEDAAKFGERAHEISKRYRSDHYLYFKPLAGVALTGYFSGEVSKTFELGEKILKYGQNHSNIRSMALGHTSMGISHMASGDLISASECFQKAIKIVADPVYSIYAKTFLGPTQLLLGRIEDAEITLREPVVFWREFGYGAPGSYAYAFYGIAKIMQGEMNKGLKMIEEAISFCKNNGRKSVHASLEYTMGW